MFVSAQRAGNLECVGCIIIACDLVGLNQYAYLWLSCRSALQSDAGTDPIADTVNQKADPRTTERIGYFTPVGGVIFVVKRLFFKGENVTDFPITAACQCGQVSYTLHAPPTLVLACHCKECQKLATSPFSVTAMVSADSIEFSGQMLEWQRSSDSGNINLAKFCPQCGNRIYHLNPAEPDKIKLKLKPVLHEDSDLFQPKAHVWVSEKVSWYAIPEGMVVYPKQP